MKMESCEEKFQPFSNICISGGTHGNELTGVYLVKHWQKRREVIERKSFNTHLCLANPKAIEKCVRYIDADLNREFTESSKAPSKENKGYETRRAREMQKWICEKKVDVIIDLHNTTSNMGVTFVLQAEVSSIALHIAACIQDSSSFPVRVLLLPDPPKEVIVHGDPHTPGLSEIFKSGIGLEVGPLAHGTLSAELFQRTEKVVSEVLNLIDEFNNGRKFTERKIEAFKMTKSIHYPRDKEGNITCLIHPEVDGKDWEPLHPGAPLFMTFDGATIPYDGPDVTWPVFINEAAYFELKKDTALSATNKIVLKVQTVQRC